LSANARYEGGRGVLDRKRTSEKKLIWQKELGRTGKWHEIVRRTKGIFQSVIVLDESEEKLGIGVRFC